MKIIRVESCRGDGHPRNVCPHFIYPNDEEGIPGMCGHYDTAGAEIDSELQRPAWCPLEDDYTSCAACSQPATVVVGDAAFCALHEPGVNE